MALATVGADSWPSVRIVLARGWDERGIVFFTDHRSQKGRELEAIPRASAVFHWDPLGRQVRVTGPVERTSDAESDAYHASRHPLSRIAAWASYQSRPIEDRAALKARFREEAARFQGEDVPRPPYWGGYRLVPTSFEFWEGRPDRLHDRLRYERGPDGSWRRWRLQP